MSLVVHDDLVALLVVNIYICSVDTGNGVVPEVRARN